MEKKCHSILHTFKASCCTFLYLHCITKKLKALIILNVFMLVYLWVILFISIKHAYSNVFYIFFFKIGKHTMESKWLEKMLNNESWDCISLSFIILN